MPSHDHTWRSADGRFGVRMAQEHFGRVLGWCQHAEANETGGILAGYYTAALDEAIITHLSSAPQDSRHGRAWFWRGTQGLQSWLDRLWRSERSFYLGEWHYHPLALPQPSGADHSQMAQIAMDVGYHCPEPILFVIGGNPAEVCQVRVFVYPSTSAPVELMLRKGN